MHACQEERRAAVGKIRMSKTNTMMRTVKGSIPGGERAMMQKMQARVRSGQRWMTTVIKTMHIRKRKNNGKNNVCKEEKPAMVDASSG